MWKTGGDMVDDRPDEAPRPSLAETAGARMKQARREKGLTLLDLGRKCGTTPQTIQRLEAATMTISLEWLEKICAALELQPTELFGETPLWAFKRSVTRLRGEVEAVQVRVQGLLVSLDQLLEAADAIK